MNLLKRIYTSVRKAIATSEKESSENTNKLTERQKERILAKDIKKIYYSSIGIKHFGTFSSIKPFKAKHKEL